MPDFTNITPYQTRKTLIDQCKRNDPEAWLAFYKPYYNYARNVIKSKNLYLSADECDELAQEVMIKVAEKIENFDPETPSRHNPGERVKFRAWFHNQIMSVAREYCRKRLKNLKHFKFNPELDADVAEFDAQFHKEREQAIQTKALELLCQSRTNPRNIEAFQMFLNGQSVPDIAAELGMAENSVHQAVCRCRRFLAERRRELEYLL